MAEFTDVIKIKDRMCDSFPRCAPCPLYGYNCDKFPTHENAEIIECICFSWAIENPEITNADKFLEIFGFHPINQCYVKACDCPMCKPGGPDKCDGCKYEKFWQKPYSESKGE